MPNAHPSLSGRPFARTLSCVLLSLCGAAAAAADSRPAFPTGFLATPHARTSPLAARETITLRNQSVLWQEGTFRTGLDVSLVGTNSLTLRGDLSTETEVRDAFAEILRISGEDNSSLAVSLETASAPTTGGSAPTQLLFDRPAPIRRSSWRIRNSPLIFRNGIRWTAATSPARPFGSTAPSM